MRRTTEEIRAEAQRLWQRAQEQNERAAHHYYVGLMSALLWAAGDLTGKTLLPAKGRAETCLLDALRPSLTRAEILRAARPPRRVEVDQ